MRPAQRAFGRADEWLEKLASVDRCRNSACERRSRDASKNLPGATVRNWMAESCVGSYPLGRRVIARAAPTRNFLVLTVELIIDGMPWLGAAPAFVGR